MMATMNPLFSFGRRALKVVAAHRGLSGLAPEGTAPAYAAAATVGERLPQLFLEGDVHRTVDGHLVIHHDDNLRRTSDIATRL